MSPGLFGICVVTSSHTVPLCLLVCGWVVLEVCVVIALFFQDGSTCVDAVRCWLSWLCCAVVVVDAADPDVAKVRVIGKRKETHVVPTSLNPVWKSRHTFGIPKKATFMAMAEARAKLGGADVGTRDVPRGVPRRHDAVPVYLCVTRVVSANTRAADDALKLEWPGLEVHVDVTDADRFSKETFLGQVVLPVARFPTSAPKTEWVPLSRRVSSDRVRATATSSAPCRASRSCALLAGPYPCLRSCYLLHDCAGAITLNRTVAGT